MRYKDVKIGDKINNLIFIKFENDKISVNGRKRKMALIECHCGNQFVSFWDSFNCGQNASCGCVQKISVKKAANKRADPLRKHNLYKRWKQIKSRCSDINNSKYGGRGIKVANEWLDDYHSFYNWSILNGYSENLEIDRIDNNGNYSPQNCRWVTKEINSNNKRNTILILLNGENMGLKKACRILNVKYKLVWDRIFKLNWTFEKAINN